MLTGKAPTSHSPSLTNGSLETGFNRRDGSGGTTTFTDHKEQSV